MTMEEDLSEPVVYSYHAVVRDGGHRDQGYLRHVEREVRYRLADHVVTKLHDATEYTVRFTYKWVRVPTKVYGYPQDVAFQGKCEVRLTDP